MDAAEAPIRGDLNEVGFLEAVGNHFVHIMRELQQILFINGVLPLGVKGEVKKGFIEIEIFMEVAEAELSLLLLLVALVLPGIPVVIIIGSLFFIGKNL